MEQTTEPDQNYDNNENEIPQHISDDDEKTQKEPNNPSVDDTQKTPENSQNTPLKKNP